MSLSARVEREKRTVGIMIKMYCRTKHNKNNLQCKECMELTEFANTRIDKCIFQNDKPVCSECEIHCYRKDMRDKIKTIMRFAGPKMIYQHPILGIKHMFDKRIYKYVDPKIYKALNKSE